MLQMFEQIAEEIKQRLLQIGNIPGTDQLYSQLEALRNGVILARNSQDNVYILLKKAMEGFLDSSTMTIDVVLLMHFRDCHLLVPKGLLNLQMYGPIWTRTQVTRCVIKHDNDAKYDIELIDMLVSCELFNLEQYAMGLVQLMDGGKNPMAVKFAMQLVQCYCIDREIKSVFTVTDLRSTIEALTLISANPSKAPEGLTTLIENLYQSNWSLGILDELHGDPNAIMHSSIFQAHRMDDPPGLQEKTRSLLLEWINVLYLLPAARESRLTVATFLRKADQLEILQTDDLISRFFRLCTEMCVDLCSRELCQQFLTSLNIRTKCYFIWDACTRLLALLVKHSGGVTNKIKMLNKVLGIVAGVLLRDHEGILIAFWQVPYHKILLGLLIELSDVEPILENINLQVLTTFCNLLDVLKPTNAPGFASAWLDIMSHRVFMGRMLVYTSEQKIWGMYAQLLIDLFKFLSPFLRTACLENPILMLHKTTLTLLLVLHDFPEFLCDHYYEFCDAMSPYCIKMRNLILSTVPRNIPVPDPFTPDLKVDMLPEIACPPRISTSYTKRIQSAPFKKDLDSYLRRGSPVTFLSKLIKNLKSNEPYCPFNYNVPLINAVVLYVGIEAINCINSKGLTPVMSTIADSKYTEFFHDLVSQLDTMGCYLFLTAICNQLTYPNSHTHYFSCLLQHLFNATVKKKLHREITRVVLERMSVNLHYPWGLLITAIELMKNPIFKFMGHDYISAPEIEKLYNYVAQLEERQSNPTTNEAEEREG